MSVESRGSPIAFLVTSELPCPYLPNRLERKIVTDLAGLAQPAERARLFDLLSRAGFRRSHSIAYRPACSQCRACVPVRIVVADFKPSASLRRILRRNADLSLAEVPAVPSEEQFRLFTRYLEARHHDGEMLGMSAADFAGMVANSPAETRIVEWRDPQGALAAAALVDRSGDGLSAVYSFFDPDRAASSLGTQIIIDLVRLAAEADLAYLYLGYWVAGSRKMDYKRRFHPLEAYGEDGWHALPKRIAKAPSIG